jgi:hypothetical protein
MTEFKRVSFTIVGETPFIMHNGLLADPLHEGAKKLKAITELKKKTETHHKQMAKIEHEASAYRDDEFPGSGLYIPSENLQACFLAGAKKFKLGRQSIGLLFPELIGYALKTPHKTWQAVLDDARTYFRKVVVVRSQRVARTRLRLDQWSAEVHAKLDCSLMNPSDVRKILDTCGHVVGLGDWRPSSPSKPGNYGKFRIENWEVCDG